MAHVHTFGQVAPAAAGIIQYATPFTRPYQSAHSSEVLVLHPVMSLSE